MRLLEGLQTVVVTGRYVRPDGRPCRGSILIEPEPAQLTSADRGIAVVGRAEAQLDESGRFTLELLATDAAGISPSGWRYRVTERWSDAPGRTYTMALPASEPTVNLPAVIPPPAPRERPVSRERPAAEERPVSRERPAARRAATDAGAGWTEPPPTDDAGADGLVYNAREHGLAGDGTTNDQPALQALVDTLGGACAADGLRRVVYCPPGVYSIRDAGTVWRSGVSLVGAGPGATRFVLSNAGNRADPTPLAFFTAIEHGAGRDNHLADCTFARFEIDGSGVVLSRYHVLAKGLGLQYMVRGRFRDLYIHDTAATGLGCDFLQDTLIEGVVARRCGRLDSGVQMGGAGIGIGIGGWGAIERLTITDCIVTGNGTNGIFLELQEDMWPPPRGIRIIGCHTEDNRYGISDWGAEGLIVSACTMIGNHEAGFDISGLGTASIAGRGGIVTNCVIDRNIGDGLGIGNTPGPYTFTANRISGNGRYGYRQHNIGRGNQQPTGDIALNGNEIWANALDGIRVDADLTDAALVDNRVRNNGRCCAPGASGGGDGVSYTALTLSDRGADWPPDGHLGKLLTVGAEHVLVTGNTATELRLGPRRPGATTAWDGGTPPDGTPYELPDAPEPRAGVTVDAVARRLTVRGNRIWDNQDPGTQTYGLWITERGSCVSGWVEDNNLVGNAVDGVRFDTPPAGGCWRDNHGVDNHGVDDQGVDRHGTGDRR
ncbi:right-handed parallel beta-helix repeat-containing protein [Planosporangium sp. 12N6]|uniref:right-handed parallel beta-helix repeat-containing protein n=1 Tax=Planosporangium spinosum TaxID=3402278 RepID=UPI003CE8B7C6